MIKEQSEYCNIVLHMHLYYSYCTLATTTYAPTQIHVKSMALTADTTQNDKTE